MFSPRKFVILLWVVYAAVVILPAPFLEIDTLPPETIDTTVLACLVFLIGATIAGILRTPYTTEPLQIRPPQLSPLERLLAFTTIAIAVYVALAGPPSPFFNGAADSFELALAREDAVKLNADAVFVRLYSWGRDLFAPTLFVLGVDRFLSSKLSASERGLLLVGMCAALYLALWSGQKATVVNFALAAFVFRANSLRQILLTGLRLGPVVFVMILALFVITRPEIFASGGDPFEAIEILGISVFNRIVLAPLTVAASYVYSVDELHIIASLDVIPYLSFLWTPGILSIENAVALEFFHQGVDSGHANALAFAYAYVLAGYAGCFFGGAMSVLAVDAARRIVRLPPYSELGRVFDALLCYAVLDLLNGNFLVYSFKILLLALIAASVAFVMMELGSKSNGQGKRRPPERKTHTV